eukprot:694849-Ditylum_brightwellii.AAC.1
MQAQHQCHPLWLKKAEYHNDLFMKTTDFSLKTNLSETVNQVGEFGEELAKQQVICVELLKEELSKLNSTTILFAFVYYNSIESICNL